MDHPLFSEEARHVSASRKPRANLFALRSKITFR